MKKLVLILLLGSCFATRAQTSDDLPQQRAAQLCRALRSRNTEALTPLLADGCRVQGYDKAMGQQVLRAIAEQLAVDTLYATAITTADGRSEVAGEMLLNGETKPCSFVLDAKGQFTDIMLVKEVKRVEKQLDALSLAPYTVLPFENRNGFIVLKEGILVDGRNGVFVLDSGAASTLFNSASPVAAASVEGSGTMPRRGVVSSVMQSAQIVRADSLLVGGSLFSLRGAAIDLSALARNMELEELTGLIGADLLRHFETHIDYRKGVVRFYRLDADGAAAGAPQPRRRIGFDLLSGYLPVFDVQADGHPVRMVFDTGAQSCCLSPAIVAQMGASFRSGESVQLRDADSSAQVVSGEIGSLEWGGVKRRKVGCVVRDLSLLGKIDGILGYPTVARQHISLNFVRQELCFY